ncbi:MAG: dihydropteroate synthase-like protein [Methanomicrobium sp.]|nr:dihydropteroate synthase-like protein [Methanomicrobium sp.]
MRILLATGTLAYPIVRESSKGFDTVIGVSGKIAAFITPEALKKLIEANPCDMVLVSGMCTADFSGAEKECGVPIFMGPRHAADLGMVLSKLESGSVTLSKTVPADELFEESKKADALSKLKSLEENADFDFEIRGVKFGGGSRMKVLAEIMDAHKPAASVLIAKAKRFIESGADIVDLGFGFDAAPEDVVRTFESLESLRGSHPRTLFSVDTQNPALIKAALPYADIVLSLHDGNMGDTAGAVAARDLAAVIVPHDRPLSENIAAARHAGIRKIIADTLIQPVGSGLTESAAECLHAREGGIDCPLFFGAGNVTELIDADSVGVNALLAGIAKEAGASVIFTSEHSDKTFGSVAEMRRAVDMMTLMTDRPYPKDLGLGLFKIKEKRRRITPPPEYERSVIVPEGDPDGDLTYDPRGNVRICIEDGLIVAVHKGCAFKGRNWYDIFEALLKDDRVSLMSHAAYLGKELYKAELALRYNRSFDQDGEF